MSQQTTLSSLQNLKRLAYQSDSITNATMEQLHGQGQQLDRMVSQTEDIHDVALKNTKMSRQIYSFWYYIKDKVSGKYSNKGQDKKSEVSVSGEERQMSPSLGSEENKDGLKNPNSLNVSGGEKEQTQEEALDELLNVMKSVKKNQKNIGQEIDRQKPMIEKVSENMDKINKEISYSNSLLHKKLNK